MRLPEEIGNMLRELEQDNLRRVMEAAQADPKKHKLTTCMGKASTAHQVWTGGTDKRGTRHLFCVADHVNAAGYILTWRERWFKKPRRIKGVGKVRMQRDQWAARKSYYAARRLAQARAERSLAKLT